MIWNRCHKSKRDYHIGSSTSYICELNKSKNYKNTFQPSTYRFIAKISIP